MTKYFNSNGAEITETEAQEIEARNQDIAKSDNIADWANIEFVFTF